MAARPNDRAIRLEKARVRIGGVTTNVAPDRSRGIERGGDVLPGIGPLLSVLDVKDAHEIGMVR
jgi:hypothetical protein